MPLTNTYICFIMKKEEKSYAGLFLFLSFILTLTIAWAVWDEAVGKRRCLYLNLRTSIAARIMFVEIRHLTYPYKSRLCQFNKKEK